MSRFFSNFAAVMKQGNVIKAISCTLMCICWLMAIVGFDIHTDHHDNRTYVVSLLSNISCESIHPDDECECEHHCDCEGEGYCCSHEDCDDTADFLEITGTDSQYNPVAFAAAVCFSAFKIPAEPATAAEAAPVAGPFRAPPRVLLNSLCVLRV